MSDPMRERYAAFFEADFMPMIRNQETQNSDYRVAYAAEFAAFQLGQIDRKLGRLIELLEAKATPAGES